MKNRMREQILKEQRESAATTGGVPPVRFDNLFVCVTQLIIHLDRAVHYLSDSVRKPSTLVAAR